MTITPTSGVRDRDQNCIGGRWAPATGETIEVVDPTTEEVVAHVRAASAEDVDSAVRAAREAFNAWASAGGDERGRVLDRLADSLEQRRAELADVVTTEVGMPAMMAAPSVNRAVGILRYYAGQAREFPYRTDRTRPDGGTTRVLKRATGVSALITPWNGPLGTAALKLGPALAAGCTAVLKTAPETPLGGYVIGDAIAELVESGDLPTGVVSVVTAGREVSESLVAHPGVDKISFTGSTAVGRHIMAVAAERVARVTLELGGKSAAIVTDDVPLDTVLKSVVMGGCGNSGQMCFGLTRVLIPRSRYDEVVGALASAMSALTVGDPRDPATMLGPLAMSRQRDTVERYIAIGREEGARVVTGGGRPAELSRGFFVEPTLFADVDNSMRIAREEIFGPVICAIPYGDVDEAVAIANDSPYGLAGSVYAADVEKGFQIASRIHTGTCSVNGAVFDSTVPFGGVKMSGLGREGGPEGMEQFLEATSVHMPL